MIHIFFVPGMFGSTLEYVLRDFTHEFEPTNAPIGPDGSMHTFSKWNHPGDKSRLKNTYLKNINTPLYPFENMHLPDILKEYPGQEDDYYIIVYANSFDDAERNILFQYHKIACGLGLGYKIFYSKPENAKNDVRRWNTQYTDYTDLAPWEFREWFSIFYPEWISEWQTSYNHVPENWLKIAVGDILLTPEKVFHDVIHFCNLTLRGNLNKFCKDWKQAQQYILDEYALIDKITQATITQEEYNWNTLHPIAEAMVQKKLRDSGFEIRCDGLDIFPTNSKELYSLLDDSLKLHKENHQ